MFPWGRGLAVLFYSPSTWRKHFAFRGKSTKFGMIIVLVLLNKIDYGPRRISARGRTLHFVGVG